MRFKDYYQTLGIERSASAEDIKRAYRKLAHQYHPDVSKDPKSEEKFKEIAEAYATLKDPDKRKEYDSLGSRPAGASFTPPPDWQQHFGAGVSYFDDVDLADILSAFTSSRQGDGRGRRQGAIAGQDYGVTAPVTLEQVFHGGEIDIHANLPARSIRRDPPCPAYFPRNDSQRRRTRAAAALAGQRRAGRQWRQVGRFVY